MPAPEMAAALVVAATVVAGEVGVVVAVAVASEVAVDSSLAKVAHRPKIAAVVHVQPCTAPVSAESRQQTSLQLHVHSQLVVSGELYPPAGADCSSDVTRPWLGAP